MNSTGKLIFALVIAANLAAVVAVSAMNLQRRAAQESRVIQLGKIVVTPADSETPTIELGAIVVTPTAADWAFAKAHGPQRPQSKDASESVVIADAAEDQPAMATLLQSMATLSPGQYLDTSAALRALNALVFDGPGR